MEDEWQSAQLDAALEGPGDDAAERAEAPFTSLVSASFSSGLGNEILDRLLRVPTLFTDDERRCHVS